METLRHAEADDTMAERERAPAIAAGAYRVHSEPLARVPDLGAAWRALESRSRCSYFLSWAWIGAWVALICDPRIARVLSVHQGPRLVALGIVTARRRFRGIGPLHLRLHEVGKRALDNITIEYNGLLAEAGHEKDAMRAVVAHLARHDRRWLTFHMAGVDADAQGFAHLASDRLGVRALTRAAHFVDLDAVRAADDYLALLSAETRATIRRTARKITAHAGALETTVAATPGQRRAYFHALVELHGARWAGRDEGGAFADPRVLRFHERLIASAGDDAGPQLLRVRAGEQVVGYLYNLLWRGRAYYYQAGIDYAGFSRFGSPGLLVLAESVRHAARHGLTRYELMAGDAAYKRSLGTATAQMAWLSIDRHGLAARARRLWWALSRREQPA